MTTPSAAYREKAVVISNLIAGLAPLYPKQDIGEAQSKAVFAAFVEDLGEFPVHLVEAAVRVYRRNPENRFFPTPAQLRKICQEDRPSTRSAMSTRPLPESRPHMWWMIRRAYWQPHWSESEIPELEREGYDRWKAAKVARS